VFVCGGSVCLTVAPPDGAIWSDLAWPILVAVTVGAVGARLVMCHEASPMSRRPRSERESATPDAVKSWVLQISILCLLWCVPIVREVVIDPPPPPETPEWKWPDDMPREDRASIMARWREQRLANLPSLAERIYQPATGLGYSVAFILVAYMSRRRFETVPATDEDDPAIGDTGRAATP